MHRWHITGVDRKTGHEQMTTVTASSEEEAVVAANKKGLMPTRVAKGDAVPSPPVAPINYGSAQAAPPAELPPYFVLLASCRLVSGMALLCLLASIWCVFRACEGGFEQRVEYLMAGLSGAMFSLLTIAVAHGLLALRDMAMRGDGHA
jgi:hypothetical protein